MNEFKEKALITNDLDGVHFWAPFPWHTFVALLTRTFTAPSPEVELQEYQAPTGFWAMLALNLNYLFHDLRPVNRQSRAGLKRLLNLFSESQIEAKAVALSGREVPLHRMTTRKLNRHGYQGLLAEHQLNLATSSSGWKAAKIHEQNQPDQQIIHIDDDLKAALKIVAVNPDAWVYLLKNFSNRQWLLRWAGVTLPENVVPVRNFSEINKDMFERLRVS